ncbi:hypothetical protein [Pseudomonas triticicola]|uniref:hypothetical protein n=1 Tax=Pseudomonas triticicola TaxID=2842345 RepID=UPI003EB925EB
MTNSDSVIPSKIKATIDPSWGIGGKLRLDEIFRNDPAKSRPLTGSLLLDDKSLIVTSTFDEKNYFISKLTVLGDVDANFGVDGRVMGTFSPDEKARGGPIATSAKGVKRAKGAKGANKRLFMAGSTTNGKEGEVWPVILCLDHEGKIVNDFGDEGKVIIKHPNEKWRAEQGPRFVLTTIDGSVIVGVDYHVGDASERKVYKALLYKFDAQGKPVEAFGTNGCVVIEGIHKVAVTSFSDGCVLEDGRLLFAGYEKSGPDVNPAGLIVMLNPNGSLNQNFGPKERRGYLVYRENYSGTEFNTVKQRALNKFTASGYQNKSNAFSNRYGLLLAFDEKGELDIEINQRDPIMLPLHIDIGRERPVNWADHIAFDNNLVFCGGDAEDNYIGCVTSADGSYASYFHGELSYIRRKEPTETLSRVHYQQKPRKLIFALNLDPENHLGCVYRYNITQ